KKELIDLGYLTKLFPNNGMNLDFSHPDDWIKLESRNNTAIVCFPKGSGDVVGRIEDGPLQADGKRLWFPFGGRVKQSGNDYNLDLLLSRNTDKGEILKSLPPKVRELPQVGNMSPDSQLKLNVSYLISQFRVYLGGESDGKIIVQVKGDGSEKDIFT